MIPLTIGILAVIANIIIQTGSVILAVIYLLNSVSSGRVGEGYFKDSIILVSIMLILFFGHTLQIALWAELFVLSGEFSSFYNAFYHSIVNFSSLGYGDIVMSQKWRLLGSLEAVSGILMFGVSTAVFYAIIRRILRIRISEMLDSEVSEIDDMKKAEKLKEFFSDKY